MKSSLQPAEHLLGRAAKPEKGRLSNPAARRFQWWMYVFLLVTNDILLTGIAFRMAFSIRFELFLPVFNSDVNPTLLFYQTISFGLIPLWLAIFAVLGLYKKENLLGGTEEYALVFRGTSIGMLFVIVLSFLDPLFVLARGWLLVAWLLAFFFGMTGRFLLRRVVYGLRTRGLFLSPALIIGANDEGCLLADSLLAWQRSGLNLLGFVDDEQPNGTAVHPKLQVLGTLDDLHSIVSQNNVEELIIATSALKREKMLEVFRAYGISKTVNLRLSSGLFEIITTGLEVKELGYVPLVRVNKVRLTGFDEVLKLILDYGLTIPGLIIISPLLLLIAIAIKLDSSGPILHRRQVMGLNGKKFYAFKFRTMVENGNEILQTMPKLKARLSLVHKLENDPRVTRVGKILRRTSLDELPQLFNVLRREMSLVGPRMISPPEMEQYGQWGINLLTVRPGLTGLWQVSGRSDVSYEKRVRLDMQYIRNWNIWYDLYLLTQTVPAVIKGKGAY